MRKWTYANSRRATVIAALPLLILGILTFLEPARIEFLFLALLYSIFFSLFVYQAGLPRQGRAAPTMNDDKIQPTGQAPSSIRLQDAMIDREGNVYGTGRMRLTPTIGGAPELSDGDLVQLRIYGVDSLAFALCPAGRDPVSGYLVPQNESIHVVPPPEVGAILYQALHRLAHSPMTFALDKDGQMNTRRGDTKTGQGLSDWRGSVTNLGGVHVVTVSAALRSLLPVTFPKDRDDVELLDGEEPPRLEIEFSIDPMTRQLRFGSYSSSLATTRASKPARIVRTSLDRMRLDSTPIEYGGSMWGITDDNRWVNFFEGRSTGQIAIIGPVQHLYRYESGLIAMENHWPRIWLNGIDLDTIVRAIRGTRIYGMTRTTTGFIGRIEWSRGNPREPTPPSEILEAEYEFELTSDGLVFRYGLLPEATDQYGWPFPEQRPAEKRHHGKLTLPWEVLIIRAPALLEHRNPASGPAGNLNGGLSKRP